MKNFKRASKYAAGIASLAIGSANAAVIDTTAVAAQYADTQTSQLALGALTLLAVAIVMMFVYGRKMIK